jgi:hypothetical protein
MIILDTTKDELKSKWKQMYQTRKKFYQKYDSNVAGVASYSYYKGKMEYTAWLLIHSREVDTESEEQ